VNVVHPALGLAVDPCPEGTSHDLCRKVYEITGNDGVAKAVDNSQTLITILLLLVGAFVVTRFTRFLLRRSVRRIVARDSESPVARRAQRANTVGSVLSSIATLLIWGLVCFWILGLLNVNLAPLIAGAGLIGIALGFGAQSLVKDFLSGIFMLLEDQYGVGDVIDVGEASGVVEGVTLRVTRIRDNDGVLWHVPNGTIRQVGNKTQQWARAVIDIGVSYDADIDRATEVIADAATGLWEDPAWRPLLLEQPDRRTRREHRAALGEVGVEAGHDP